jgi:hypothetical protein
MSGESQCWDADEFAGNFAAPVDDVGFRIHGGAVLFEALRDRIGDNAVNAHSRKQAGGNGEDQKQDCEFVFMQLSPCWPSRSLSFEVSESLPVPREFRS